MLLYNITATSFIRFPELKALKSLRQLLLKKHSFCVLILFSLPAYSDIKVAVSIAPIHSLVTALMSEVAEPVLLMNPGQSPHIQSLPPSSVKSMHDAQLIIWIGPEHEISMKKALDQNHRKKKVLSLLNDTDIEPLPFREHNIWSHDHQGEDHNDESVAMDPHIWLSFENTRIMVDAIVNALIEIDPLSSDQYLINKDDLKQAITETQNFVESLLAQINTRPYLVFHDAYQYFEREHDLSVVAAVNQSPETTPGIQTIRQLKAVIENEGVQCMFTEPQFHSKIVDAIIENTNVQVAVLDPLGASIAPGSNQWHFMMRNIAESLYRCLQDKS